MQAPVSTFLGIPDIIGLSYQHYIILSQQTAFHGIHVVYVIADNSDSCKISKLVHRFDLHRPAFSLDLLLDAADALESALHMVYRIVIMLDTEFIIQYLQLGADLLDGCAVSHTQIGHDLHHFLCVLYRHSHLSRYHRLTDLKGFISFKYHIMYSLTRLKYLLRLRYTILQYIFVVSVLKFYSVDAFCSVFSLIFLKERRYLVVRQLYFLS